MRRPVLTVLAVLLFGSVCSAQAPTETQPVKELTREGGLGSCAYAPTEKEKPFFNRLAPDERVTGSAFAKKPYRIQGKKGRYVSWFGIVRVISHAQQVENQLTLLLEQKYFDGVTDCHIMLVAQSGSGDFEARLEGDADSIPALALVRVYGKVVEEVNGVPKVAVEYIRVWPWMTFTFSDFGAEDHSNPRWAQYCKVCKEGQIYNPYPTLAYYLNVLGEPKDFGTHIQDAKQK